MKKFEKNGLLIWVLAVTAFIISYLLIRFTGTYTGLLSNAEGDAVKSALFEVGLFLFVLIVFMLGGYFIYYFWRRKNITPQNVGAICALMVLTLGISVFIYKWSPFAMPVVLVPLILSFISEERTAKFMTIIITLLLIPISASTPSVIFINLFTGMLANILASKVNQRREFPVLGITLALSNIIGIFLFHSIWGFELNGFIRDALISALVTFICVIGTIGLLPFFETFSGVISAFALMDLVNPTNKLLKRLIVEAPGTYYHSLMVGNLAEAAAEKIGANGALARVAAYYHDVGKLKNPLYFMENQHGDNIHDNMDPYESADIITAHTSDGVKLAEKYHLPPQITEIIGQHHGDTLVACFYKKALDMAEEDEFVSEADFRYKEKRPSSKEAGIIMLADSVEAATKALNDKSTEKIRERINSVVSGKISDGQLDECPLTLKDIEIIKKQFLQSIDGYYHKRDEYPGTDKKEGSREKSDE